MAFYIKKSDKKSGDGLSMTEWNDINRAVGGDSGLTLALTSADNVGIGTNSPSTKLEVTGTAKFNGVVSIGNAGTNGRTNGTGSSIQFLTGGMDGTLPNVCIEENFGMNLIGTMGVQGDKPVRIKNAHLLIPEGNVGIGTSAPVFKLHVNGSMMANKYVVQNETDGGNSRGIFLWAETNASWGIYLGQSGANKSLSGGVAVTGAGFTQHAVRFRANNNTNHGFLFENSSEELLLSIRGSDGMTHIRGNVGIGTTTPVFKLHVDGSMMANKYVVQNSIDGGNSRGIFLWNETDSNWGIYMGQSGAGKSLSGGKAVAGAGFTDHAVRFRAYNALTKGFLFENSAEELLMSIRSGDGMTHIKGNVGIGIDNPTEKLEVNGKVKATHFIGDGSGLTNLSVGLTGLNLATTSGNVGIGTNAPVKKLHVAGDVQVDGRIKDKTGDVMPVGSIIAFGGNNYVPDGWLVCDGKYFSEIPIPAGKPAACFDVLRSIVGDFLPDLSGRFIMGAGLPSNTFKQNEGRCQSDGTLSPNFPAHFPNVVLNQKILPGYIGGSYNHELTIAEMPEHNHNAADPNQNESGSFLIGSISPGGAVGYPGGASGGGLYGKIGTRNSTSKNGSSQPHNNMPPFYALVYIIKY